MNEDIKRLRDLSASASLPPWSAGYYEEIDDEGTEWTVFIGRPNDFGHADDLRTLATRENMRLIAALRNETPAILDELEMLRQLKVAVLDYWAAVKRSEERCDLCHPELQEGVDVGPLQEAIDMVRAAEWSCPVLSQECLIRKTCTNKCGRTTP